MLCTDFCTCCQQVTEIAKRHGLGSVDPQVFQLISRAMDSHLGSIIQRTFRMTRQRTDTDRTQPGMILTENLRKRLHEINMRQRDLQDARQKKGHDSLQQVVALRELSGTKKSSTPLQQSSHCASWPLSCCQLQGSQWQAWKTRLCTGRGRQEEAG